MNPAAIIGLLNSVLPSLIAFYRELRNAHPEYASLTDEQMIDLFDLKVDEVVATANKWLTQHP